MAFIRSPKRKPHGGNAVEWSRHKGGGELKVQDDVLAQPPHLGVSTLSFYGSLAASFFILDWCRPLPLATPKETKQDVASAGLGTAAS